MQWQLHLVKLQPNCSLYQGITHSLIRAYATHTQPFVPEQVELLVDFLTGNLGAPPEQQLASRVVQLVIAGGSLGQLEVLAAPNPYSRQQTTAMEPVRWARGQQGYTGTANAPSLLSFVP